MKNLIYIFVVFIALGCSRAETLRYTVNVDVSKNIKTINKNIFGFNLEWIEDGNFIWDASEEKPNKAIFRSVSELRPSILRFPGGVFSDFYHWNSGVGDSDNRKRAQPSPFDGRVFDNVFGTKEFLDFCRGLGAEPLITVNVGTGTSEEAADWVRYCNISNKIKPVRIWELGNELYINSDEGSRSISITPQVYFEKIKEFSIAMEKADPSIKIMAIGGKNTGLYNINYYPDWDELILRNASDKIDYLAVHNAYYPAVVDSNDYPVKDVYKALFGANKLIKENIDALNKEIATFAPLYKDKIKIAVTEWGPLFSWAPDSPYRDQTRSLGSAIYIALVLKTFITSDNVEIANFFKLSGSDFMALIQKDKKSPAYYAFQMFSSDFGDILLDTSCGSPSYSTDKRVGIIPPLKDIPLLESIATKDKEGNVYIILINKDLDSSHSCLISLNDKSSYVGNATILTGNSVDSQDPILESKKIFGKGQINYLIPAHSIVKIKLKAIK